MEPEWLQLYFMVGLSMQMQAWILHFIFMPLFALLLLYWSTHWRQREAEAAQTPLIASVKCAMRRDEAAYSALWVPEKQAKTTGSSLGLATWLIRAKEVNTHARLQLRNIVSFSLAHRVQVHAPRCWCGNYNFIPSPALRPQRAEKRKPSFIIKHKTVFIWAPRGMCTSLEAHSHFCRCVFMLYIPGGVWRLIRSNKR